jgi:RNA polymerase sigma-70 factor (ECF subfamily)
MIWNETQLLRRLQSHDRAAFEAVVERNYQLVFRQLYHLCHDEEVAADLTQETFARAWNSLDSFAGKSSVRTWLYTIAVRVWWRWKESQQNQKGAVSLDEHAELLPDESLNPAQKLEVRVLREDVQAALRDLPSPFRETVVLFYIQNLKYREVAEVLDVSIGTVKSRLHEGLKQLKVVLQEAEQTETEILQGEIECKPNLKTA